MAEASLPTAPDNTRLRWGLAVIVGLMWLYGVLLLRDELAQKTVEHNTMARSLARLQAELAQPEWTERVKSAKALSVQLESRLWQAPTSGLAQAAFQEWLKAAQTQAGLKGAQITGVAVDEAASDSDTGAAASPGLKGLRKVSAKLRFEFAPATLLAFLNLVEAGDKRTVVSTLLVRREPQPVAEMEIVAWFQKQDGADKSRAPDKTK